MSGLDFVARGLLRRLDSNLVSTEPGKGQDYIGRPTKAQLLASAAAPRGEGAYWHGDQYVYQEVSSGEHFTTAGGVKLRQVARSGLYDLDALDDWGYAGTALEVLGDNVAFGPRHVAGVDNWLFWSALETLPRSGITIMGGSTHDTTFNGVEIGARGNTEATWNEQQARTGWTVRNISAKNVGQTDGSSYAVALVAKESSLFGFDLGPVNLPSDPATDSEVLYTKLQDGFIFGGVIRDGGRESAFSVKGQASGSTDGPNGHGNFIAGIKFDCSASFAAADGGRQKHGMKIQCGGNDMALLHFQGWTGRAIYTTTTALDDPVWQESVLVKSCGAANEGCDVIGIASGEITKKGVRVLDPGGYAFEVNGQTEATLVRYIDCHVMNVPQHGFRLAPLQANMLEVEIIGGTSTNVGDKLILATGAALKRLHVENHVCRDIVGQPLDAAVTINEITWRNSPVHKTTTDATATTVIQLPVPTDGAGAGTVKVWGTDGTDIYFKTFEVAHVNSGGTATEVSENGGTAGALGTAIKSSGASAWTAVCNTVNNFFRIRVNGESGKTISWKVDVDYYGKT